MDFNQVVQNVVGGKSAQGKANDFYGVPSGFSKDIAVQAALAQACVQLRENIKESISVKSDEEVTIFVAKMAAYASKQGWNRADKLTHGFNRIQATLKDAVLEAPELLLKSKAGIQAILRKHEQVAQTRIAQLRQLQIDDNNAPPPQLYELQEYELVELLSPAHLKAESISIGGECCVGTSYNMEIVPRDEIGEFGEIPDEYLTYAIKIRTGESRIFSLRDKAGKSWATIEYDVKEKAIVQIEGNPKEIKRNTPFFSALCQALWQLEKDIPIRFYDGLPTVPSNQILLKNGQIRPYESIEDTDKIIEGGVQLNEDMSIEEVHGLCQNSGLTLNVGACSMEWLNKTLPKKINASLSYSDSKPLHLKYVEYVKNIFAHGATSIRVDALIATEYIWADSAESFSASVLNEVSSISAKRAKKVSIPSLVRSGDLYVQGAKALNISRLKIVSAIFADAVEEFIADALMKANSIHVKSAKVVSANALIEVLKIDAQDAQVVNLPSLVKANTLSGDKCRTLVLHPDFKGNRLSSLQRKSWPEMPVEGFTPPPHSQFGPGPQSFS